MDFGCSATIFPTKWLNNLAGCFLTFPIFSYQSGLNRFRMACFVTFPNFSTKVVQFDSMANFGCFATFPIFSTEVVEIDSEWPILAVLRLFQYFSTKVVQFDSQWPILAKFCNFSNIFLPKWSKLIQNGQFWLFCNFSNIFLPKWSK